MVAETQTLDPNDPLAGYSGLSLLPQTFSDLKKSEQGEEESLDAYLNSMFNLHLFQALRSPHKLVEQATDILKRSSEIKECEFLHYVPIEDKDRAVPEMDKNRPQERRPALGRKRAQFSMKPNPSQPSLDENTSLNIDDLLDPKEIFSAFEKHKNVTKELRKLKGEISVGSEHNSSTKARVRRPGILGKTVHIHRYTIVPLDGEDPLAPSQDVFKTAADYQLNSSLNSPTTDHHDTLQERELAGDTHLNANREEDLVAETDNEVNNLYDQLMSRTNLDEDETLNFLQERLQKPLHLKELNLPDLDSFPRRSDAKEVVENLLKPRKALQNIHNMISMVNNEVSAGKQQISESSSYPQTSPTLPKSPFSTMTSLQKRNSQRNSPQNKFSFPDIDISPNRKSLLVNDIDKQAPPFHVVGTHLDANDPTPMPEESIVSENLVAENPGHPCEPMDINTSSFTSDMVRSSVPAVGLEDKVEDKHQQTEASEEPEHDLESLTLKNMHGSGSRKGSYVTIVLSTDNRDAIFGDHFPMNGQPEVSAILPEQNREEHQRSSFERSKQKAPTQAKRKRKEIPQRKSLAGAGTVLEAGVRKSTRHRVKPLDFAKGERFIYGRVHESLLTVIGVKYESPGKGFTVKSFAPVPDKYKKLFENSALY
ncbi:hypothetical protein GIB67_030466 [Kingdonia uniflora]|uniref:Centromere protein C n=1 Tax=Kingdonia uniflora TaxID=39325 RepID=A0A7J7P7R9_9MAGN|nr:hypothetical protein GIB67_030466 [Kingdonia uniflora]